MHLDLIISLVFIFYNILQEIIRYHIQFFTQNLKKDPHGNS